MVTKTVIRFVLLSLVFPGLLGQRISVTYPSERAGNASLLRSDHVT